MYVGKQITHLNFFWRGEGWEIFSPWMTNFLMKAREIFSLVIVGVWTWFKLIPMWNTMQEGELVWITLLAIYNSPYCGSLQVSTCFYYDSSTTMSYLLVPPWTRLLFSATSLLFNALHSWWCTEYHKSNCTLFIQEQWLVITNWLLPLSVFTATVLATPFLLGAPLMVS